MIEEQIRVYPRASASNYRWLICAPLWPYFSFIYCHQSSIQLICKTVTKAQNAQMKKAE